MLAYVFWHWRYPHVTDEDYRQKLVRFHEALREQRPPGFHYSVVLQVRSLPWLETNLEVYEEWYLLDGSSALDPLNEAAVSGVCEAPHRQVAQHAAGGAAGLYRLRRGEPNLEESRFAAWFAKPRVTTYDQFYGMLQSSAAQANVSLWVRQMVLGPAPEFCLRSPGAQELPEQFDAVQTAPTVVWSGRA